MCACVRVCDKVLGCRRLLTFCHSVARSFDADVDTLCDLSYWWRGFLLSQLHSMFLRSCFNLCNNYSSPAESWEWVWNEYLCVIHGSSFNWHVTHSNHYKTCHRENMVTLFIDLKYIYHRPVFQPTTILHLCRCHQGITLHVTKNKVLEIIFRIWLTSSHITHPDLLSHHLLSALSPIYNTEMIIIIITVIYTKHYIVVFSAHCETLFLTYLPINELKRSDFSFVMHTLLVLLWYMNKLLTKLGILTISRLCIGLSLDISWCCT